MFSRDIHYKQVSVRSTLDSVKSAVGNMYSTHYSKEYSKQVIEDDDI